MKKIVCTAVSALALAAFADGVNSTEFGVLTVPSSAEETIVSVPWLESGTGPDPVKVADLVLTAGLTAAVPPSTDGDTLKYYNGSTWDAWVLTEGEGGVKSWVAEGGAPTEQTVVRGRALLLKRPNKTNRADHFYIMGKPTTSAGTVELGSGYTLIAPPAVSGSTDVNTGMTWTNIDAADQLIVPTTDSKLITLTYRKTDKAETTGWGKMNTSTHKWEKTGSIPAGFGAWFSNNGTTASKSYSF